MKGVLSLLIAAAAAFQLYADVMKPLAYPVKDWRIASHKQMKMGVAKLKSVDLVFLGDSITQGWTANWLKHHGVKTWNSAFKSYTKVNLGLSSDKIEHLLWRITEGGIIDGFKARMIIVMIGTNNGDKPEVIAKGVDNLLKVIAQKQPQAKILLLGVLPVSWRMKKSVQINDLLVKLADNKKIFFKDYSPCFLTPDGKKYRNLFDGLHPDAKGYEEWGVKMKKDIDLLIKK